LFTNGSLVLPSTRIPFTVAKLETDVGVPVAGMRVGVYVGGTGVDVPIGGATVGVRVTEGNSAINVAAIAVCCAQAVLVPATPVGITFEVVVGCSKSQASNDRNSVKQVISRACICLLMLYSSLVSVMAHNLYSTHW
jgi:hypothetical protein